MEQQSMKRMRNVFESYVGMQCTQNNVEIENPDGQEPTAPT